MTTVTIQLSQTNLKFITRKLKKHGLTDATAYFNALIAKDRQDEETERINSRMEKSIEARLARREKLPFPTYETRADIQNLLAEAVNSGEPVRVTKQEWRDLDAEVTARYEARQRRKSA